MIWTLFLVVFAFSSFPQASGQISLSGDGQSMDLCIEQYGVEACLGIDHKDKRQAVAKAAFPKVICTCPLAASLSANYCLWCYNNCIGPKSNDGCKYCVCTPKVTCKSIGPWTGLAGYDTWCYNFCFGATPNAACSQRCSCV